MNEENDPSTAPQQAEESAEAACPRCGGPLRQFPHDVGAGSRVTLDRTLRICGLCGRDEAVRDAEGLAPVPPSEWPVTGPLLTWHTRP